MLMGAGLLKDLVTASRTANPSDSCGLMAICVSAALAIAPAPAPISVMPFWLCRLCLSDEPPQWTLPTSRHICRAGCKSPSLPRYRSRWTQLGSCDKEHPGQSEQTYPVQFPAVVGKLFMSISRPRNEMVSMRDRSSLVSCRSVAMRSSRWLASLGAIRCRESARCLV